MPLRITIEYELYKFEELNEKAKKYALNKFYEINDFNDILSGTMEEWFKFLLTEKNIESLDNYKILYSLSWSQGDGVCFTGTFKWKDQEVHVTHNNNRYYHENSVEFSDCDDEFKNIYKSICQSLERNGYETIEYEMSDDRFKDYCEDDDSLFFKSGQEFNKYSGRIISNEETK